MKSTRLFLFSLITLVLAFGSMAHAEQKIGIVRLQDALNMVEEGKQAKAAIEADMNSKKKQLDSMKTELKAMQDDMSKKASVLSDEAKKAKANEMQTKLLELQQKAVQYEQELKQKENDSVQKILSSLKVLVTDIAKRDGYSMVYENSADVILFSTGINDITPDVIKAYNAKR